MIRKGFHFMLITITIVLLAGVATRSSVSANSEPIFPPQNSWVHEQTNKLLGEYQRALAYELQHGETTTHGLQPSFAPGSVLMSFNMVKPQPSGILVMGM